VEFDMSIKDKITEDMKTAMKARETSRLATIRLILAALKQKEVDERITLDDAQILAILDKMVKQRRDSISQFEAAGREDLAIVERAEVEIIQVYLPQAMSEEEIDAAIRAAIAESGATAPQEMSKVMALLKPRMAGRADMGQVSGRVKGLLG
jgi:uncharacterized protein YqeY